MCTCVPVRSVLTKLHASKSRGALFGLKNRIHRPTTTIDRWACPVGRPPSCLTHLFSSLLFCPLLLSVLGGFMTPTVFSSFPAGRSTCCTPRYCTLVWFALFFLFFCHHLMSNLPPTHTNKTRRHLFASEGTCSLSLFSPLVRPLLCCMLLSTRPPPHHLS